MTTECQPDISTLIGKCECAIRRGTTPNLEELQTLQQHLVMAQDAPDQIRTEEQLKTAMNYYVGEIPADVRRSELALFTDAFKRTCESLSVDERSRDVSSDTAADD